MRLTRILPVVVCPEMSSPAQSFASVMNVPSNSCLPWRAAFCSFCFGSFGENSGSFRQQRKAKALHSKTMVRPAKKVKMLDRRKHHHFRSLRQPSSGDAVVNSSQPDMMMRCSCWFEWRFGEWWLLLSRFVLSPRSSSFQLHPRIFIFFLYSVEMYFVCTQFHLSVMKCTRIKELTLQFVLQYCSIRNSRSCCFGRRKPNDVMGKGGDQYCSRPITSTGELPYYCSAANSSRIITLSRRWPTNEINTKFVLVNTNTWIQETISPNVSHT